MLELERTADAARAILLELRDKEVQRLDESTREILSESLVSEIFEQAWRHQFEEDRRQAKRDLRQVVADAIEQSQLGEEP